MTLFTSEKSAIKAARQYVDAYEAYKFDIRATTERDPDTREVERGYTVRLYIADGFSFTI